MNMISYLRKLIYTCRFMNRREVSHVNFKEIGIVVVKLYCQRNYKVLLRRFSLTPTTEIISRRQIIINFTIFNVYIDICFVTISYSK